MVSYALFEVDRTASKDKERSLLVLNEGRKAKADQDAQYNLVGLQIHSRIQNL